MTVTNNGDEVDNVRLLRSADLDVDNTRGGDVFDKSSDSAWARQLHAVSLSALNETGVDLAVSVRYDLGEFEPGESKSVRFRYRVY